MADRPCIYPALGTLLKQARLTRGASQQELATILGVNQATISKFERGTRRPETPMLAPLARALGLEPSRLAVMAEYIPSGTGAIVIVPDDVLPEIIRNYRPPGSLTRAGMPIVGPQSRF